MGEDLLLGLSDTCAGASGNRPLADIAEKSDGYTAAVRRHGGWAVHAGRMGDS